MNLRIKKVRKALDLTQQSFAERIGLKQNSIALIESGKRNISDQAVLSICREFDVREEWLRTGNGEMFKPKPSDILDQLAYKYKISNADYVIIEKFLSLRPEIRKGMFDYFREVTIALEESEPYSMAYGSKEAPFPMDNILNTKTISDAEEQYKKNVLKSVQKTEGYTVSSTTDDIKNGTDNTSNRLIP